MKDDNVTFLLFGLIIGIITTLIFTLDINDVKPIHVYQGKTTLEYKIVDGVKVDSCVIFKKK